MAVGFMVNLLRVNRLVAVLCRLTQKLTASRLAISFGFSQNRHRAAMRWSAELAVLCHRVE